MLTNNLNVREATAKDIPALADYWHLAEPDFLIHMGVDLTKLPPRDNFVTMLSQQFSLPINKRQSYALIWEVNNQAVGHGNVNKIHFGNEATMHLHIWKGSLRQQGLGTRLVKESLPFYFNALKLKTLICEPYALNEAPNKTLKKIGFTFVKKYQTIPGAINFEQEVNRWEMTRKQFDSLK